MKRQIRVILFTLTPAVLWFAALKSRNNFIEPFCGSQPERCLTDALNPFDRPAVYFDSGGHDTLSFVTQYGAAAIALLMPLFFIRSKSEKVMHFIRFLQVTIWNGFFLEIVRIAVQRPRPFVYLNPADFGKHVSHYTSFYSGHTSFTAAICLMGYFSMKSIKAPSKWVLIYSLTSFTFVFTTAYARVMAGRHFPSDVLAAIVAGIAVASGVNYVMRGKENLEADSI